MAAHPRAVKELAVAERGWRQRKVVVAIEQKGDRGRVSDGRVFSRVKLALVDRIVTEQAVDVRRRSCRGENHDEVWHDSAIPWVSVFSRAMAFKTSNRRGFWHQMRACDGVHVGSDKPDVASRAGGHKSHGQRGRRPNNIPVITRNAQ